MAETTKATWMGRDIDALSREELLEVVSYLNRQLESARQATRSIIEMNNLARRLAPKSRD